MDDGRWVPCICAEQKERQQVLDVSGLQALFLDDFWDRVDGPEEVRDFLMSLARDPRGIILLWGGDIQMRLIMATSVIMSARRRLDVVSIGTLVDDRFRDQRKKNEHQHTKVPYTLWIRCDFPAKHSWNESTLNDALAGRVEKFTVVTMQDRWLPVHVSHTPIPLDIFRWRKS